jgi:hypothetical protein
MIMLNGWMAQRVADTTPGTWRMSGMCSVS